MPGKPCAPKERDVVWLGNAMQAFTRFVLRRQWDEQDARLQHTDRVIELMRTSRTDSLRRSARQAAARLSHR